MGRWTEQSSEQGTGRGGERPTRNLLITVHDNAGEPAAGWELRGVMPVAYSPACQLDALAPDVVTETLTLSVAEVRPATRSPTG